MSEKEAIGKITGKTLVITFPLTGNQVTHRRIRHIPTAYEHTGSLRTFRDIEGRNVQLRKDELLQLAEYGSSKGVNFNFELRNE